MENNKKILLFHVSDKKTSQIKALCNRMQIVVVPVKDTMWGQSLGSLAGIKGIAQTSPAPSAVPLSFASPSMEMMVFSGIPSNELDSFLANYREAGIPIIPLKAIITPYNIFWNANQLYQELQKEHSQLQK